MAEPASPAVDLELDDAELRLHDLGSLTVEVRGIDTRIRGDRPIRILTTLLVHANQRVAVDTLMDAVWGDAALRTSSGTLESHVWRLRNMIEPRRARGVEPAYLINDTGGYRLLVNPDCADSLRFPQLAEQGDLFLASGDAARALERYELALALWRGRPFDAVADDEWVAAPLARLAELHGQVNEQRIAALLRTGGVSRAVRELEALTVRLPYRERLWTQLMLGLYETGRVEEALAVYGRARDVLVETIGLEPGPALRDLQRRILEQDPTLTAAPASPPTSDPPADRSAGPPPPPLEKIGEVHLPTRLSGLVGREIEVGRLTRLVERNRLVTLVGAAGCGKTRLAIEVARSGAASATDGVWFIDLAAVEDPSTVADVVVSTIGLERPPVGTALAALRSYVRDHRILLLLDNCEHVLSAVFRLLDAVLDTDSQCRVLATSREPTGFDGEVLWTLSPLAVHDGRDLGDSPSPAAQLFVARAQSADPMFDPAAEAMTVVEEICTAVDGIPLAIELAAGRTRSASLPEVRAQVSTELAGLGRLGIVDTEHHRTVELSIEWSVRLLSDAEQAAHARLSVLPGPFTSEAARAVVGADPVRPEDVAQLLTQLTHRSLLGALPAEEPGSPTRFRQLATVRAHAARALGDGTEAEAARGRRAGWIGELLDAHPSFGAGDTNGWNARMADNHDTLTAVLHYALVDHLDPVGVHLAGKLGPYWVYHRRLAEGSRWFEVALRQLDAADADRASVELGFAYLLALRDRTDRAAPLVRSALARAAPANPRVLADKLGAVAWCAFLNGSRALDFVDDEIRRLGADDDPVIALYVDVLAARAALTDQGPIVASTLAAALFERAERLNHVGVAWLAAWLGAICALATGDPTTGLPWLLHVKDLSRRLSGLPPVSAADAREAAVPRPDHRMPVAHDTVLEFDANFATLAGDHERAAGLFGRSSRLAFRGGFQWPLLPGSQAMLATVRGALGDRFDAAWRAGETAPAET